MRISMEETKLRSSCNESTDHVRNPKLLRSVDHPTFGYFEE